MRKVLSQATLTMLVDCPHCARSYHIVAADLGASGRTLICPRCQTHWHQPVEDRPIELAAVSGRPCPAFDERPAPTRRPLLSRRAAGGLGVALAGLALVAVTAATYVGREAVVRTLPRTAMLYAAAGLPVNVAGLGIEGVRPERAASNDVTIRGTLHNVAGHRVGVPRLAFEVRDAADRPLATWSETVATRPLPAGRKLDFASTPHRLPPESRTVVVSLE